MVGIQTLQLQITEVMVDTMASSIALFHDYMSGRNYLVYDIQKHSICGRIEVAVLR